ncbi:MAG: protein arginine phosphatase [Thermoanaerobacteraceae bacterium]|uniref:Low molecular weight protein arginine phosphatase n=1 Tax=Biomaibacter acetigenes TaxID=2316383 RepID=A0A3G2R8R0_9FIRM|nr:low molecular weight protein arginine phosphatase [Biomaibacter acetigenes]AYO31826.1 low molecular weight protein arginine phosphatase [Biomaibacter acetigenes]MDK2879535.1 protein arginine phosphatase [Thermoanaerobacteraceae bacterium]MDN5302411.1 protein arginine phosphatase [Thermoanaerobacteraceae bacterium]RKL62506.1 low molecular weight protein arginine phosphatase [Thermoanaerobacteraceae bacterium SP2]
MKRVVFVCTGNTCRSSMAEALFKKILKERGRERDIMVESCGIAAVEGMPASPNAVKVMKEEGIDISSHRARLLSEEILKADLILTMTKNHKDYILNKFPETKGRVFVLEEFASGQRGDENVDISDPYGGDEQTYRRVADEIKEKLKNVLARLEKS